MSSFTAFRDATGPSPAAARILARKIRSFQPYRRGQLQLQRHPLHRQIRRPGHYTFSSTLQPNVPSGTINFVDTDNGFTTLTSASLVPGAFSYAVRPVSGVTTTYTPTAIATGDCNADGYPDLFIGNTDQGFVTISPNSTNNGSFNQGANSAAFAGGANTYAIAAGDFDRDGKIDIVVTLFGGTVNFLHGNGDCTFTLNSTSVTAGNAPSSIAVGDFNNDGYLDIAISNKQNNYVNIFKGNGSGNFTALANVPIGSSGATGIVAVDFNNDGNLDLAVASGVSTVIILKGNGDGTFSGLGSIATGTSPYMIVAGDFNGDGNADLATVNYNGNNVTVLAGAGNGTFTALASPSIGRTGKSIAVLDFDGDGVPDLVTTDASDNLVYLLHGNGDGTFTNFLNASTGTSPQFVTGLDANGDGILDLVAVGATNQNAVYTLIGSGTASATATAAGVAPVGSATPHDRRANYPGDGAYTSGFTGTVALTGTDATTTTVNPPSTNTGTVFGTPITLHATVADTSVPSLKPTGTVTFYTTVSGSTYTAGMATLSAGVATLSYTPTYGGTNVISAAYTPGTGAYQSSTSSSGQTLSIALASTIQYVSANDQTLQQGVPGVLTITIAYPGTIPTTGAVSVTVNGSAPTGLGTPTCVAKNKHTNCSYPYTPTLSPGSYSLVFTQASDANYNSSTGTSTLTITPPPAKVTTIPARPVPIVRTPIQAFQN